MKKEHIACVLGVMRLSVSALCRFFLELGGLTCGINRESPAQGEIRIKPWVYVTLITRSTKYENAPFR